MSGTTPVIRRPLMVAISGGAGCLSSIEALATTMQAKNIKIPIHRPVLRKNKIEDRQASGIRLASRVMNAPGVNSLAAAINFPIIPSLECLEEEMISIDAGQKKERVYVDLLIDVVDAGYLIVAMCNFRAKGVDVVQSRKMVDQQRAFERLQFARVKSYFLEKLLEAREQGSPYTEIVTTQMICMDAICEAVLEYNTRVSKEENIHVHQYMSDIFTEHSQHYVQPLRRLREAARSILHLHGMNVEETADILLKTRTQGKFASIEEIDYLDNPMVRQGFKSKSLAQFRIGTTEAQNIPVQNEQGGDDIQVAIEPEEKIAAIMLSSVGGESTANYVDMLSQLYTDHKPYYDKIFVFCGRNKALKKQLEQEKNRLKGREAFLGIKKPCEIIIMGNQDAEHVANIFTRSDLTIIRGGFVLMEEMALGSNHHPQQRYFFPHLRDNHNSLTTGLPWEDASIDCFINHLRLTHRITWAKKGEVDDLRFALKPEWHALDVLNSYKHELKGASRELNAALYGLLEQLSVELESQYTTNTSAGKVSHRVAYQLAMETMKYIDKLAYLIQVDTSPEAEKKVKLMELIKEYDAICHPMANTSKFSRSVINVIAASIGFVVGFVIGVCIGLWTGPGALATGLLGATVGGVIATGSFLTSNSFFKPNPIEQKRQALVEMMHHDFSPNGSV